jgi:hypothetical protein
MRQSSVQVSGACWGEGLQRHGALRMRDPHPHREGDFLAGGPIAGSAATLAQNVPR